MRKKMCILLSLMLIIISVPSAFAQNVLADEAQEINDTVVEQQAAPIAPAAPATPYDNEAKASSARETVIQANNSSGREANNQAKYLKTRENDNQTNDLEVSDNKKESENQLKSSGKEKTFTVTKRPVNDASVSETLVGEYDTFMEAVRACKQEDMTNVYIVTMNDDYTAPDTEGQHRRSSVHIILRSKAGHKFTLKKTRDNGEIMGIDSNATLKTENIIFDGGHKSHFISVYNTSTLTLDRGTVVQNFVRPGNYSASALAVTGGGTLNILDGVEIKNNKSDQVGGFIVAERNSTVNIEGGTFKHNSSERDGGFIAAYGNLNISGGIFEENRSSKTGGAILTGSSGSTSIKNAKFNKNQAGTGGAIYAQNNAKISSSSFEDNSANWGGALFLANGGASESCTFKRNSTEFMGGAIYATKDFAVDSSTFEANTAKKQGGAIYIEQSGNINKCNFSRNTSVTGGGAIFIGFDGHATTKVSESKFEENKSSFGGGIYLGTNSKLEVTGSKFENNKANFGGGISSAATVADIDVNATEIKLSKSETSSTEFTNNQAYHGGGLFTAFPTEIESVNFIKNSALLRDGDDEKNPHASGVGGGIYLMDNKTTIKKSVFKENSAYGSGGAIGINGVTRDKDGKIAGIKSDAMAEITDNTQFIENKAGVGQGGAIYVIPYEYKHEVKDKDAYKKLTTDETTVFLGNKSDEGLFLPPKNYKDFINLEYAASSDVEHGILPMKSLLNNYDVNYKSDYCFVTFINDNKKIKTVILEKGKTVKTEGGETMPAEPKKNGFVFIEWNTKEDGTGDKFTEDSVVNKNMVVYAIYKTKPIIKNEAPTLEVKDATIEVGESLDLMSLVVKASDPEDGDLMDKVQLVDNGNFDNKKVGKYTVTFKVTDKAGASVTKKAIVTVNKKTENAITLNEAPTLEVKDATIEVGESLDLMSLVVKASDPEDGDLMDKVQLVDNGNFDNKKVGKYTVTFKVTDKAGASVTKKAIVTVNKKTVVTVTQKPAQEKPTPDTGDDANIMIYLGLFVLSGAMLIAFALRRNSEQR